jgi:3-oxoacyl-[acyl-carrier protein] reductase
MGGYTNGVAYSASKAGLIGLTTALARRVAEYGVTVNAIAPGTTRTDIIRALSDEQIDALTRMIPAKKLGEPEEIGEAVAFLVSEKAGYITGAVLDINGGLFTG